MFWRIFPKMEMKSFTVNFLPRAACNHLGRSTKYGSWLVAFIAVFSFCYRLPFPDNSSLRSHQTQENVQLLWNFTRAVKRHAVLIAVKILNFPDEVSTNSASDILTKYFLSNGAWFNIQINTAKRFRRDFFAAWRWHHNFSRLASPFKT